MENKGNSRYLLESMNIFKALGNDTRLKIVVSIYDEGKSVSKICEEIHMTQSAVSHQLQILKLYHIVKDVRRSKEVYYYLHDEHVKNIIEQAFSHTSHTSL